MAKASRHIYLINFFEGKRKDLLSVPVHALWRLSLKQNDKEMPLLVQSNIWKKYYYTVKHFAASTDTLRIFRQQKQQPETNLYHPAKFSNMNWFFFYFFSIPSPGIRSVPNSKAYSCRTIKN